MAETDKKWEWLKLSGGMSAPEAEANMLHCLEQREEWADHFVNATYYLEKAEYRYDGAYQVAYMKAGTMEEKATEKQKDAMAKTAPAVIASKLSLMEAKAAIVKAKTKLEGCTLAHHSCKKVLEKMAEERYL